jgi:NADPH2:quinone reductase
MGILTDGTVAERALAKDSGCVPLPHDLDPATAVALGVSGISGFLAVAWKGRMAAGERVLVLGATGATGTIALQTARLLKPRWLVAAGRDPDRLAEAKERGAHMTVCIGETDDLADQIKWAFGRGNRGPTLVIDLLFGEPLNAALKAAMPGARIVQAGQAAGGKVTLDGAQLRGKSLEMLGFSIFHVPLATRREALLRLVRFVRLGDIKVDVQRFPLENIAEAWRLQKDGPGGKIAICPWCTAQAGSPGQSSAEHLSRATVGRARRHDKPYLVGLDDRLEARVAAEALEDAADVVAHGDLLEEEPFRDRSRPVPVAEQPEDLELTWGERPGRHSLWAGPGAGPKPA